ncbi:MAG TPA: heparinase II/III family protein, partial [bacterium]
MNRMMLLIFIIILLISHQSLSKERPSLIITKQEAAEIKAASGKYALMDHSIEMMQKTVEHALSSPMEVPPPGEAGGYEHERHKQNYREMQQAGILFTITDNENYARFVRDMLLEYAKLYPTLGKHPQAQDQAPGKLFHQMLNETVWLTYTGIAYDCIYDWLDQATRANIEQNVFRIIIDWFITENHHEFNRIHNHGTWTVCSIGLIGYVLEDQNLVDMALYGTEKDGNGGFLKQLDLLFSPDGYYMEGPYYVRYAMRPFFFFAEAIERNQPDLRIYEHRNQILKKAYYSAVQTTFPNGIFPPINDASRTMDIKDVGVVLANSLVYSRCGTDPNLLAVVKIQNEVLVNGAGLKLAQDFTNSENIPDMDWGSIEFIDGYDGDQGCLGILRMGTGNNQSMLLMKYGVHGEGHGHFDKLHFIFYDQDREVIPDYGFCRWINIEPKFGGRYLRENKSYAMQTIAHNTVTVDQTCQNNFDR